MGASEIRLRRGATHFEVDELLAYPLCGEGEHLYVRVEKRGIATDQVADALAVACGRPRSCVGFAGRKDRHAIARQWLSIQGASEPGLAGLEASSSGRARVLEVGRHRNKLRLGHLRGNRFRLGLEASDPGEARGQIEAGLARAREHGLPHRFGPQRFGRQGSTLRIAQALGAGDLWGAVSLWLDPQARWRPGDPLPSGSAAGPAGRIRASLRRRPDDPRAALRAAGRDFHKLAASAAQSAVFNAVLAQREREGRLHSIRTGEVVRKVGGGLFVCRAAELEDVNRRAAPGCLEVVATGPLPGTWRMGPEPEPLAEEQRWSRDVGVDWAWLYRGGPLESPGDRRSLVIELLEPGACTIGPDGHLVLEVALPRGSYATELLAELGVELPPERGALDAPGPGPTRALEAGA